MHRRRLGHYGRYSWCSGVQYSYLRHERLLEAGEEEEKERRSKLVPSEERAVLLAKEAYSVVEAANQNAVTIV